MKRMNKLTAILATGVLAAAAVFTSCENSFSNWEPSNDKDKFVQSDANSDSKTYATLVVNEISLSDARTINPVCDVSDFYKIILTGVYNKGTAEEVTRTLGSYSSSNMVPAYEKLRKDPPVVSLGPCEISIKCSTNSDETSSSAFIYEDTVSTVFKAGVNKVSFNLTCTKESTSTSGDCSIHVEYNLPETVLAATGTLYKGTSDSGSKDITDRILTFEDGKFVFDSGSYSISVGYHTLCISLFADTEKTVLLGTYRELVNCKFGLASKAERTIENVEELYEINFELNGADLADGLVLPSSYSRFSKNISLPTALHLTKKNEAGKELAFSGWYESEDFSTERVSCIESGSSGNKTYYAKWTDFITVSYPGTDYAPRLMATDTVYDISELCPLSTSPDYSFGAYRISINGTEYTDKVFVNDDVQICCEDIYYCCTAENVSKVYPLFTEAGNYSIKISEEIVTAYSWKLLRTALNNKTEGVTLFLDLSQVHEVLVDSNSIYASAVMAVNKIKLYDKLEKIVDGQFLKWENVDSINIPATVSYCGKGAFYNAKIDKMYIEDLSAWLNIEYGVDNYYKSYPQNVTAYLNGEPVTDLVIPEDVKVIKAHSINWKNKMKVTVPATVTSIEAGAFLCSGITEITLPFIGKDRNIEVDNKDYLLGYIFSDSTTNSATNSTQNYNKSNYTRYYIPASLEKVTFTGSVIPFGAFSGCGNLIEVEFPEVEEIPSYAFYGCRSLSKIKLSEKVKSIKADAFRLCTAFSELYLDKLDTWFTINREDTTYTNPFYASTNANGTVYVNEKVLSEITIPASVTEIPVNCFYGWGCITNVTVPNTVTKISEYAFNGCYGIKEITLPFIGTSADAVEGSPDSLFVKIFSKAEKKDFTSTTNQTYEKSTVTEGATGTETLKGYLPLSLEKVTVTTDRIGKRSFENCSTIKEINAEKLTTVPSYAFYKCSALAEVKLGNNVVSVGGNAFYECSSLTEIDLGSQLTSIDISAFYYCKKLAAVNYGDKLKSIGSNAFYSCSNLSEIYLPESLTEIESHAFYGCSSMAKMRISSVENWCEINFGDSYSAPFSYSSTGGNVYIGDDLVTELSVPSSLTVIPAGIFEGWSCVETITIPSTVTEIGADAFSGLTKVTKLEVPSSVTKIGKNAFSQFTSLTELVIPFIGLTENSTGKEGTFTSIFDSSSSTGITQITQYYPSSSSTGYSSSFYCYVPSSLRKVTVYSSTLNLGTFSGCSNLTEISCPNFSGKIDAQTFRDCSSLTKLTIGSKLTETGKEAFYNCKKLETICASSSTAFENVAYFDDKQANPFYSSGKGHIYCNDVEITEMTIPAGSTEIGAGAFKNLKGLEKIYIPASVTSIKTGAFIGCSALTEVYIEDKNVFVNATYADSTSAPFYGSGSGKLFDYNKNEITELSLAQDTTEVKPYCFYGYSNVKEINTPDSITKIGDKAFDNCTSLEKAVIGNGVERIPAAIFVQSAGIKEISVPFLPASGGQAENGKLEYLFRSTYQSAPIPSSLKKITVTSVIPGASAFNGGSGLEEINIPEGLTEIYTSMFEGCSSLKSFDIPDTVEKIGNNAFRGCSSLTSITLPENIETVGTKAFENCSSLEEFKFNEKITTIGTGILAATAIKELNLPFVGQDISMPSKLAYLFGTTFFENSTTQSIGYSTYYIPKSLRKINVRGGEVAAYAFSGLDLDELIIADGVQSLGDHLLSSGSVDKLVITNRLVSLPADLLKNTIAIKEMEIPFVGTSVDATEYSEDGTLFRVIFGTKDSDVPKTLEKVTIAGGKLFDKAFMGLSQIKEINLPSGLTSIPDSAFKNSGITELVIPSGVTSIGASAFAGCAALTQVNIPSSVSVIPECLFDGCSSLLSIDIPAVVESIGDYAFNKCSVLADVVLPSGLTSIGKYAFAECNEFTQALIPDSVEIVDTYAFYKDSKITAVSVNAKAIGDYAFATSSTAVSLTLGSSVETIGKYAFNNSRADGFTIPASVTSIGAYAFEGSLITSIEVPATVETLGSHAFSRCNNLVSATVKCKNVDSCAFFSNTALETIVFDITGGIGARVIENCTNLKTVEITCKDVLENAFNNDSLDPYNAENIIIHKAENVWDKAFYKASGSINIEDVRKVYLYGFGYASGVTEVPDTITYIGQYAFSNCVNLTKVRMNDSITYLNTGAFTFCTSLNDVVLSNNLVTIETYAFSYTTALQEIDIPESVKVINKEAFLGSWCVSYERPATADHGLIPAGIVRFHPDGCKWNAEWYIIGQDMTIKELTYSSTSTTTSSNYPMPGYALLSQSNNGKLTKKE